jgi:hypothetical protein
MNQLLLPLHTELEKIKMKKLLFTILVEEHLISQFLSSQKKELLKYLLQTETHTLDEMILIKESLIISLMNLKKNKLLT